MDLKKIAIMYDFDETLVPMYMQYYSMIPYFKIDPDEFWQEKQAFGIKNNMDSILSYMYFVFKIAKEKNIVLTRPLFHSFAKDIVFYNGVETWFERINSFGASLGFEVEHYVLSSGHKEIIEATSIAKYFKKIFATCFYYNDEGVAVWPSHSVNFTNKTQYITRIRKGLLDDLYDDRQINEYVEDSFKLPYSNMFYIGDGLTDIPCMKILKQKGGHSICVFNDQVEKSIKTANKLMTDKRVDYIAPADYSENSVLENIIKNILNEVSKK